MIRTTAVQRINDALGFRPDGHSLEAKIILRLQEAQRDLEKGKTLPKFLLQQDQTLALVSGNHSVTLPTGFIREDDDNLPHFTPTDSDIPIFLTRKYYIDAVMANIRAQNDPVAPSVFVLRGGLMDFVTTANQNYTITWSYYKKAALLTSDVENEWLDDDNMPEYLIGEAGFRIASDLRDKDAMGIFDGMRKQARLSMFSEEVADEDSGGPIQMGANL